MFVLSCNLYQRHSDLVRIGPSCFDRNIFTISQQKTGNRATVNIDLYAIDAKTTYRILNRYGCEAPYKGTIGNYNYYLHSLMRDIGFTDEVRIEERRDGRMTATTIPKWKLISRHTARRTAITIAVLRGQNVHTIKRCSGHSDLRSFEQYVRDE
jgi:integrase